MQRACFQEIGLSPASCGVHGSSLVRAEVLIDANAPIFGYVSCLLCPISRAVVDERRPAKEEPVAVSSAHANHPSARRAQESFELDPRCR
jgi:hypothetical protein